VSAGRELPIFLDIDGEVLNTYGVDIVEGNCTGFAERAS
jgi:hypothetical protein